MARKGLAVRTCRVSPLGLWFEIQSIKETGIYWIFFPTIMILQSKTLGGPATNYCQRFDDFLSVLVKYVTEHEVQFTGLEPHPHKSSRC